ncbi:MAG: HipA N-terminal domain-containing protein [Verrucomicrobia bacterium]|nr:HipA N-terminal domain-containing protein [Verrucomicrobiota bacterium]
MTAGAVYYKNLRAGVLRKIADGYEFTYDDDFLINPMAAPISLSLPLRSERYLSKELFPFFDGLLPEGWLLHLTSKISKIDENDKFNLLLLTGEDPIGAVSVRPLEDDHE